MFNLMIDFCLEQSEKLRSPSKLSKTLLPDVEYFSLARLPAAFCTAAPVPAAPPGTETIRCVS